MTWSKQAIEAVQPIYHQIMAHPFIQQLANGTLSAAKFHHYIEQDTLYLAQYRNIMAAIAAKCDNSQHQKQFLHFSLATIEAEQAVHQYFMAGYKQSVPCTARPATLLYTGYLYQQLSTQPLPVIVASILPCFYLYQQVGACLLSRHFPENHPYYAWIATYASDEFKQDVATALNIADELAENTLPAIQHLMTETFLTTAKMEWLFWDSAWRQESWPV